MSDTQILDTVAGPAILKHTPRSTLAISVLPDGHLELTAPVAATQEAILDKVAKRLKWIEKQRRAFAAMNATRVARRFVTGATHRYLGRQYRLKITKGPLASVHLKGAYFHVVSRTAAPDEVRQQLDEWFREKAKQQFQRRLNSWHPWCRRHQLPEPQLLLRRMPKRWGSASGNGRIALTPELVHAPSACIDYVIAHEICHLRHPSHGPQFFRLLTSLLPDWQRWKDRLERAELT